MSAMYRTGLLTVAATLALAPIARGQAVDAGTTRLRQALQNASARSAAAVVDQTESRAVETLISLGSIISPSGHEQQRAAWVAQRMRAIGLKSVTLDSVPNAVGIIPGRSEKALLFVSTLDDLGPVAEFCFQEVLQMTAIVINHIDTIS